MECEYGSLPVVCEQHPVELYGKTIWKPCPFGYICMNKTAYYQYPSDFNCYNFTTYSCHRRRRYIYSCVCKKGRRKM
ncbi:unnamed protein product [Gongylonema pulchrum]|uniref:8.9 kDa family member n=1 Tax=Gongylonema pulchrum TaxID=637853 RepID=A0A183E4L1_9BILA|nr:unnamed protein product [Gongylonema pulchrum]